MVTEEMKDRSIINMKKIMDISQPLDARTAVWPGDTPFSYQLSWTIQVSGCVNVGEIKILMLLITLMMKVKE
jgi:kynurenine formamidase